MDKKKATKIIRKIYHLLIPYCIQKEINYKKRMKWYKMARIVEKYYCKLPKTDEQKKVLSYLKKHHFSLDANKFMYLSDIVSLYEERYKSIPVLYNSNNNLPYIIHQNKPLFFPKDYPLEGIRMIYCQFLSEMDYNSPHVYCKNPEELNNRILLDCGVAEGLFPLTYIDRFAKLYLFECDAEWVEALNATFEPYKDKVTIIQKYVSNTNSTDTTTLDFYKDAINDNPLFIKMDIEGYEENALEGAKNILTSHNNTICAICTYHTPKAETNITTTMESFGYKYQYNQGYMIFHCEKVFAPPYLRRGVIRFYKATIS